MPESSSLHRTTYHNHDTQTSKELKRIGLVLPQILCTLENDELCLIQQAKDIALSTVYANKIFNGVSCCMCQCHCRKVEMEETICYITRTKLAK